MRENFLYTRRQLDITSSPSEFCSTNYTLQFFNWDTIFLNWSISKCIVIENYSYIYRVSRINDTISFSSPNYNSSRIHVSVWCTYYLIFEMLIDVNHGAPSHANRWIQQLIRGIDCNNGKREFDPSSRTLMSNYYHAASLIMGRRRCATAQCYAVELSVLHRPLNSIYI